ncbi:MULTISPECIES: dTDP-4-dehydrorhamnose reductase [Halomonadaceae]|uniref:dTDP-4-dehydrorhamnose reductase n=1 Tax=Halomonadaceae TaxID=28256 RepID=UPI0012F22400|nr:MULTISPECIES: dTDP-4-dehydrorhamnose reductase [Halomonas]CAD5265008.1 dTDP-4-dehydrorhamnose reductase subunit, NAD(P)-binding, of dTDP-L-rhamnose synthase [Halomonas sp. 156]CAD5266049.1 dTDP-4-dehydrorhamnose reductase subunit, NAD(P)-binding, of dTDP-L-rhamnose synthase [Halomonas sp. I3]CAD5283691.1 dTDP-4-dehydrorhamnose reductase subunit, NAD(P)-binding, of dTDP-L-rhamnose synthase [Halomonas sp. 113]CAD5285123.1 dTDP-4-dehydrorhamnose reductase subunit, NAD(P)-binding, of dTDP-L-rham
MTSEHAHLTPHASPLTIFITGGNGQVGFELQRQFALFGNILAPTRQALDLTNAQAVDDYLAEHKPSLILNAGAYTAVDKAESEPEQAKRLNAELPAQLAEYAAKHNIPLVHYSTDYVYPGDGETPWQEDSPTAPLSVYGQTKLEGDQAVTQSGCQHLIFRTSWVYAARGNNFMKTMLRLGRERDALSIVNDQIGAPTPARLIAQATALAFLSNHSPFTTHNSPLSIHIPSGIYHLAPRGETSWHGFASEIFKQAQVLGEELAIQSGTVSGIPTVEFPTPAQRPLNSRMRLTKLEAALGVTLPVWQHQLALTLAECCEA